MFRNLTLQQLKDYKILIFILIVGDIFGIYWYLGWKKLGVASLIVMFIFLAIFLILESNKSENGNNKDKKRDEKTSQKGLLGDIFGTNDSEEIQKRFNKAFT